MFPGSSVFGAGGVGPARSGVLNSAMAAAARRAAAAREAEEEERRLDEMIDLVADNIHIAYTDSGWVEDVEHRELSYSEISSTPTRDLCDLVSYMLPMSDGQQDIRFDKIVVLKEDDLEQLRTRVGELLKEEECKLVNFGIFTKLKKDQVLECFTRAAKTVLKKTCFANALGRIWSMEYNGSGRGCGLVAADDKIHVWRDV